MNDRYFGMVLSVFALACVHQQVEPSPSALEGVRISATTALTGSVGDTLTTWVTVVNTASATRTIEFDSCPPDKTVTLTSAAAASSETKATWDYRATIPPSIAPPGPNCVPFPLVAKLAPHDSTTSRFLAFPVRRVLGDSLPPGVYWVRVFPRIAGTPPAGIVAGQVELRASPR